MPNISYKAKSAAPCKEQALLDMLNTSLSSIAPKLEVNKKYKKRNFDAKKYSGCAAWFSAAQGVADPTDGTPIPQWNDLSGNNRHAVQATSSRKPTFKTNIIADKPAVRFDGIDDYLNTNWTPAAGNYSIYMVMIPRVIRNGYQLSGMQSAGAYLYQGMYRDLSGNQFTYNTFGDGVTLQNAYTFVVGTPYVRTLIGVRSSKVWAYINKVAIGNATATFTTAPSAPYLIGVNNALTSYAQWDILELAIYNQAHTTTMQSDIENTLCGKYGI